VAVVDEFGCKSEKDITVNVICNELNYFVPNTFSPNGDGSNDVFYPRGKGLYNIVSLRIFNRWGEQVFERRNFPSNDPASGWNGLFKGKTAPAEVYVYILEVICDNAQVVPLKGNVTLLR
jgi:gliding motility-associated-like protein